MKRNFIVDEEISLSNGNDILKTKIYADNLSDVISNTPKDRVFTIGLFGGWGTGKSSIIKTVREKMETSKVKFITYDAWKYANDSFRRMFLLKVQEELKYDQTEEMQRFYQSETAETEPKTYISNQGLWVVILILLGILVIINCIPVENIWKISLSSSLTLLGLLITIFNGVFQKLRIQISKPQLFAPEQFESCFKEMVTSAFKQDNCLKKTFKYIRLIPKSITGIEKLIIVIDNIDRCHSEMAYQLLTDIKTFLSDEKMNVVFVIPVDDEALKQNLFSNHKEIQNCNKDNEEFLRKFFNVTIRIKPHQLTELNAYARGLNKKHKLGYNDNTIALCSKEFANNPRRIIQLFNNLATELNLYPEDFAQRNESIICIILILREVYNEFYNEVVKDVNKLKKQNSGENRDPLLSAFMRIAAPIIRDTEISDLLQILTNSNAVFEGIPHDIKNEISSYSLENTIEYINSHPDDKELVLYLIKKNIEENIKSDSDVQITNSLEFMSGISCSVTLSNAFLVEIDSLFKEKYNLLLPKIDKSKLESLCQFALTLENNHFPVLKNDIISYVNNINIEGDNIDELFIKAVLLTFNTKEDCGLLNTFILSLFKKNGIYKDIDYSQEQKEILISNDLIQHYIEHIIIGENNETTDLLWVFQHKENIEIDCYSKLFEKLDGLIGNTTNRIKDHILAHIKFVDKYLTLIPNNTIETKLATLNNKLWQRTINNRNTLILDEYTGDTINTHLIIDFFINTYRINYNVLNSTQAMRMITADRQYTYSKLIELKKIKYDLFPFGDSILNDKDYETCPELLLQLIEFCILQKNNNGELAIDKDKIKNKVMSLCDNISKPEITKLIERLIKDNHIKPFFIEVITSKDSDYINSLPHSLLELATNSFNKENFSQFEKNTGFLSVIASKGTDEQKTVIVKMMTENINKTTNLDETFKVLDSIVLKKSYNKDMLKSALQAHKESNPKDSRVDALITKFEK